jgi:hypothetical protein
VVQHLKGLRDQGNGYSRRYLAVCVSADGNYRRIELVSAVHYTTVFYTGSTRTNRARKPERALCNADDLYVPPPPTQN